MVLMRHTLDAWTSVLRIQEFLSTEEQQDVIKQSPGAEFAVSIHDSSFVWEQTGESVKSSQSEKEVSEALTDDCTEEDLLMHSRIGSW